MREASSLLLQKLKGDIEQKHFTEEKILKNNSDINYKDGSDWN